MNKHPEPLFQKRNFSPPGMINFANIFITPPKTFQFDLGVAGKEILTLSALYRSCQFLPLSDRTIIPSWRKKILWMWRHGFLNIQDGGWLVSSHSLFFNVSGFYIKESTLRADTTATWKVLINKPVEPVSKVSPHDVLLIIGDMNAKVGSDNTSFKWAMRRHGCGTMNVMQNVLSRFAWKITAPLEEPSFHIKIYTNLHGIRLTGKHLIRSTTLWSMVSGGEACKILGIPSCRHFQRPSSSGGDHQAETTQNQDGRVNSEAHTYIQAQVPKDKQSVCMISKEPLLCSVRHLSWVWRGHQMEYSQGYVCRNSH